MTRRIKIIATTTIPLLMLAAGCGNDSADDGGGSGGSSNGGGTLVVSTWDVGQESGIDAAVADFEEANPDVTVELVKTPWEQHMQALRRQFSAGEAPDVAVTILGYGEAASSRGLADLGLLTDLGQPPWAEKIPEGERFLTGDGGKTFALPLDYVAIGAFYNPEVFADAGLEVPTTFTEVLDLCGQAAEQDKVAVAMGGQEGAGLPHFLGFSLAASLVYSENQDFSQQRLADETTFADTAGWQQTLDQFAAMTEAGCFGDGAAGSSREAASQAFAQGDALIAVAPTVSLPLFQGSNPDATFEMFPFPASDDPDQLRVMAAPATGMVVPERAGNPDLGKRFVDFYAENRVTYSEVDHSIPGVPTGPEDSRVPDFAAALNEHVSAGQTAPVADATWPNPEVLDTFSNGLVDILLGNPDSAGTVAAMDSIWTAPGEQE